MIYHIYSYKNKKINAYSQPVYSELPLEYMIESVKRHVFKGTKNLADHQLYLIGTFDDNTGILKNDINMLVDIDEEIKEYESKYRESK